MFAAGRCCCCRNVIGIPLPATSHSPTRARGDDPPGLGADAGDNIRIHPVAREQRYAGEIQDLFIAIKASSVGTAAAGTAGRRVYKDW